jgi:hypothetical protein
MKLWAQYLITTIAAVGISFTAVVASAETCTLELKRLESQNSSNKTYNLYRITRPQSFNAQIGPEGKSQIRFGGADEIAAAFKKIVKTEPKYESDHPFRGVVKLGSQEYAFALDEAIPDSEKNKAESEDNDAKFQTDDAKKETKDTKSDSAVSKLAGNLLQALSPPDQADTAKPLKAMGFNRLYFDFNHNGDLTDDKVIEAEPIQGQTNVSTSYSRFQFPRTDVTIDIDGTKVDYAFFLSGNVIVQRDFSYAGVQINAAAYREGEITLDGNKRRVVILDNNSNGRFDDNFQISKGMSGPNGQVYLQQGDMLLIDPDQENNRIYTSFNQAILSQVRPSNKHYVSKIVDIDGRCYDMKISPAGDELTLTPSTVRLGKITNSNAQFNAVIYSDQGVLEISGKKDTPISIPEGEWKLLSYNINQIESPEPSKPAEKKEESKKSSGVLAIGQALESILGNSTPVAPGRRFTMISAQGTAKYKPVKVREGETVEFPFGPPYKPLVTLDYIQNLNNAKQAQLGMSLVGSVGEMVTNMMVGGSRPAKPEFTIKDPKGEVVQTGNFEYG